ncbi:MAG: hypothetical protein ACTSSJ_01705 [Candidatus Odinarchaeia archaeon]
MSVVSLSFIGIPPSKGASNNSIEILYLYNQDSPNYYDNWRSFLANYGFQVSGLNFSTFLQNTTIASNYHLIITDHNLDNQEGTIISYTEACMIADTGTPILTLGYSGWIINKLANFTPAISVILLTSIKVYSELLTHPVYTTPYMIEYEDLGDFVYVTLTDESITNTITLNATLSDNLTVLAWYLDTAVILQYSDYPNNNNIYFSSCYDPVILNLNGKHLMINLITWIIDSTITKEETTLTINLPTYTHPNETFTIQVNLTDTYGTPLDNERVNVYMNDTLIANETTNSEGILEVNITTPEINGTLYIRAEYPGSLYYMNSSAEEDVLVIPVENVILTLDAPDSMLENETVTLTATLVTKENVSLSGGRIEFYFNNISLGVSYTDDSGTASILFNAQDIEVSQGNFSAVYTTNLGFKVNSNEIEVVIHPAVKIQTQIEIVGPTELTVGETAIFTVYLTSVNGARIEGESLLLYINDTFLGVLSTDAQGCASFKLSTENFTLGNLKITVEYSGNNEYNASSAVLHVSLSQQRKQLILQLISPEKVSQGECVYIKVIAVDENGVPVKNIKIKLYVDGKLLSENLTDEEGIAEFTFIVTEDMPETLNITAVYEGNTIYSETSSNSIDIKIVKYDFTFPVSSLVVASFFITLGVGLTLYAKKIKYDIESLQL